MDVNERLLALLRSFAVTMTESYEITDVLHQLGDSAVAILEADSAGISLVTGDGKLEFVSATDRAIVELEEVQQALQAGPCVLAFQRGEPVVIPDISAVGKWLDYRAQAARSGFGAVVGMPLMVGERRLGSVNIYQRGPRDWSHEAVGAVRVFAEIAAAYVVRAGQLADALDLAGQLQHALDSRVIIEQAKGILSLHHDEPVGAAFERLRDHARRHNRTVREVARDVVHADLRLG